MAEGRHRYANCYRLFVSRVSRARRCAKLKHIISLLEGSWFHVLHREGERGEVERSHLPKILKQVPNPVTVTHLVTFDSLSPTPKAVGGIAQAAHVLKAGQEQNSFSGVKIQGRANSSLAQHTSEFTLK